MITPDDLRDAADANETRKAVNLLLLSAFRQRASDILIGPQLVQLRVDGVLQPYEWPADISIEAAHARLKVMANPVPDDAHIMMSINNSPANLGVSIVPVAGGEQMVLHVL